MKVLLQLLLTTRLLVGLVWADSPGALQLVYEMVLINNLTEFNNHLEQIALKGQEKTLCRFNGKLKGQEKNIIERSRWQNYSRSCNISYYPDGSVLFDFELKDHVRILAAHHHPEQKSKLTAREQKALHVAQERIKSLIRPGMSNYEKILTIHDDIVSNTTYTLSTGSDCCTVLLERSGVCDGFSRTMWLLLRMCDIPCQIVIGHTTEPHAWNLVKLNNSWYHLDATWDAPIIAGTDRQLISHDYFMVSDEQISRDHSWDRSSFPAAVVRNHLYYRNNNRYFNNYDQMWKSVVLAIRNGDTEYEAYLADFGNKENFLRSLRSHSQRHPELSAIHTWTGPVDRSKGVIRLTFHHSDSPTALKNLIADFFSELISSLGKLLSDLFSAITKAIRNCF